MCQLHLIIFGAWPPTAKYQPTFMPIDLVQRDTNIQTYRESVGELLRSSRRGILELPNDRDLTRRDVDKSYCLYRVVRKTSLEDLWSIEETVSECKSLIVHGRWMSEELRQMTLSENEVFGIGSIDKIPGPPAI